MRNIVRTLFAIILLPAFLSCSRSNSTLYQAESVMEENPDSVLSLLQSIRVPEKLSRKNKALHALLLTQAMHKCDYDLDEFPVINAALEYYRTSKDTTHAAKAYLYAALVAEANYNEPLAIEYYLKAKRLMNQSRDYKYQYLVRIYLGRIYRSQWLVDEQLENNRQALDYALLMDDNYYLSLAYNELGIAYAAVHKQDSAIYFQEKALALAGNYNENLLPDIYYHLWYLYENRNDIEQMRKYAGILQDVLEPSLAHIVWGETWYRQNQMDSALHYARKSLQTDDVNIKASSCLLLADVFDSAGRYDSCSHYLREYNAARDSIDKEMKSLTIIKTQNLGLQNHLNEENLSLQTKNMQKTKWIFTLGFCVVSALLAIGLIVTWYRQKQNKMKRAELEQRRLKEHEQLEHELKISKLNELLYELMSQRIPKLESKNHLKEEDWEVLIGTTNRLFDNFTVRLQQAYPQITDRNIRMCCLLKMDADIKTVALLLSIGKSSAHKQKQRFAEKAGFETVKEMERYIQAF